MNRAILISIIFLISIPNLVLAKNTTIWYESGEMINIYSTIGEECVDTIYAEYRVNGGEWTVIWDGGWDDCVSNVDKVLLTSEPLGPFDNGDEVEYHVKLGRNETTVIETRDSVIIGSQTVSTSQFSNEILLVLFAFGLIFFSASNKRSRKGLSSIYKILIIVLFIVLIAVGLFFIISLQAPEGFEVPRPLEISKIVGETSFLASELELGLGIISTITDSQKLLNCEQVYPAGRYYFGTDGEFSDIDFECREGMWLYNKFSADDRLYRGYIHHGEAVESLDEARNLVKIYSDVVSKYSCPVVKSDELDEWYKIENLCEDAVIFESEIRKEGGRWEIHDYVTDITKESIERYAQFKIDCDCRESHPAKFNCKSFELEEGGEFVFGEFGPLWTIKYFGCDNKVTEFVTSTTEGKNIVLGMVE